MGLLYLVVKLVEHPHVCQDCMFKFYSNQFVFVYPKVDLLLHSFVCFLEVYLHSVLSITLPAPDFTKLIASSDAS